ncbi:1-phosphatidylinositol 4,5-bisphosphate phosphodiesterase beta-4-like [Sycon ciliatum]|uniref:1-phosphatidylinositol 4,5-bisphosphate phosphodiesterase beta-4-like n=1 Tax=Sycon ciliatum TaxID=27933 RepID=UPI0031F64C56
MAGATPQTFRLKPNPPVPSQKLQEGFKFRRWDDDEVECTVRVDETGLIMSILFERREGVPIYLSELSDVRTGRYARPPKDHKLVDALIANAGVSSFDEIGVTIVYGTNLIDVSFLCLAAYSKKDAVQFSTDIQKLMYNNVGVYISEQVTLLREHARLRTLRHPEKNGIAAKHIQTIFAMKNGDEFRAAMEAVGWDVRKTDYVPFELFTLEAFLQLYERLVPTPYVDDVFKKIVPGKSRKPYTSAKEFKIFLNEFHRDPRLNEILFKHKTVEDAEQIIRTMEPKRDYADKCQLTKEGLLTFLRSKENAIIHLSRFGLHQDMEQPLCHYYINSSHNTYLTGHQLTGKATVEIYRQVLLTGCRCIELDCWDGADGEPVITHGKTMVNNIPFVDVVEAINETAFKVTDFPVILSFENHCRFRQQRKMVHYLRTILTDKLILEPLEDYPIKPGLPLPPPSRLRGKIICKNKLIVPRDKKDDDRMGTLPRRGVLERDDTLSSAVVVGAVCPRRDTASDGDGLSTTSSLKSPVKEESQDGAGDAASAPRLPPVTEVSSADDGTRDSMATSPTESDNASIPSTSTGDQTPAKRTGSYDSGYATTSTNGKTADSVATDVASPDEPGQASSEQVEPCAAAATDLSTAAAATENSELANGSETGATAAGAGGVIGAGAATATAPSTELQPVTTAWTDLDMPSLVNYAEPIKFRSFGESEENNKHYQMSSFPETGGVRLVLDFPKQYIKYTQRQNTRIYPKGTRVDSSNYQPQVFWNVGCQMVSLNFQTLDLPMQLNLGKFDYNGMCGYLLKPEVMRRSDRDFDPFAESPIQNIVAATITVQILAGHLISNAKEQVRVEVDMYGIPADTVRRRFKTRYVPNDVTVIFPNQPFEFKKVILPDLAMLRLGVVDSQGTLLGMRVLPLDGLEPGFRYVHLNNERNQSLSLASLFVHIKVSEYIPEEMQDFAMGLMDPIKYQRERHQAALSAMTDDDLMDAGNPNDPGARRTSDPLGNAAAAAAAADAQAAAGVRAPVHKRQSMPATQLAGDPSSPAQRGARPPGSAEHGRSQSLVPTGKGPISLQPQPQQPANGKKFCLQVPKAATGRDILTSKEAAKELKKLNKDISSLRKKFLKSHASLTKAQASELKKQSGKGDAGLAASLKETHEQAMVQLAQRAIEEEGALVLKLLPLFFAWVGKAMAARHAGELKQFDECFKREVAALAARTQKTNTQQSQNYREEQKKKVTDKEELQRKIREYRNKIVENSVSERQEADRVRMAELSNLEKAQSESVTDVKAAEDLELDRVRKVYETRTATCTGPNGLEMYVSIALEDKGLIIVSLSELP